MKWLQDLVARAENMIPNEAEQLKGQDMRSTDKVVGEPMSMGLRKLHALVFTMQGEARGEVDEIGGKLERIRKRGRGPEQTATLVGLHQQAELLKENLELAGRIFWACLNNEYPETIIAERIGIRKGWRVVIAGGEKKCDCPGCQLREALKGLGGVVVVEGGPPRNIEEVLATMFGRPS